MPDISNIDELANEMAQAMKRYVQAMVEQTILQLQSTEGGGDKNP